MVGVRARIAAGIAILRGDERARTAFRIMNLAIARAARRRLAGADGDPDAAPPAAVAAVPARVYPAQSSWPDRYDAP
jgi:hypothetical protein